jgi:hypothetical protein
MAEAHRSPDVNFNLGVLRDIFEGLAIRLLDSSRCVYATVKPTTSPVKLDLFPLTQRNTPRVKDNMKASIPLPIVTLLPLVCADARMNLYHDPNCRDLSIPNYTIGTEECQDPNPGYSSVIIWDGDNADGELPLLTFYK